MWEKPAFRSPKIKSVHYALFAQTKQHNYMIRSTFVNGWFLVLQNVYKLVQRLGDCWGVVIRSTICKTAHKCLLHHVVDLCCGLSPKALLIWLIAGPGNSGGYLNPPLTHLFPTHPLMCTSNLSKLEKAYWKNSKSKLVCLSNE